MDDLDYENLELETKADLLRERDSLIHYINVETLRGGAARTEYRQLEAIEEELESRVNSQNSLFCSYETK